MKKKKKGKILIFRKWITTKNGRRIYAKDKGLKSFPIWIDPD